MKTNVSSRQGTAVLAALLITLTAAGLVLVLLAYSSHSAQLTRRSLDHQRAKLAAEAGLDYGIKELLNVVLRYQLTLTETELQGIVNGLNRPPAFEDYEYRSPDHDYSFRISVTTPPTVGTIPYGNVGKGMMGEYQLFTITCGALNPQTGVGAVLTQQVQALGMFLIRFGVFYEDDLEILPGPPMFIEGPVHGNSDIYVDGPLEFRDTLSAHMDMYHRRKDDPANWRGGTGILDGEGTRASLVQNGQVMSSTNEAWMTEALALWRGRVLTGDHAVPKLDPPINPLDEAHDIIERPLEEDDELYHKDTEKEKFANKAALKIHVDSGGTVTATDHFGNDVTDRLTAAQPAVAGERNGRPEYQKNEEGDYVVATPGSFNVEQVFYDGREDQYVAPVDIYVDGLLEEFPELVSGTTYGAADGRGVVYVTRDDPSFGNVLPAVRLRNAREMPSGGLTVASDLPVYVEGNYNTVNQAPCMVTGDAVNFLSSAWQDARSTEGIRGREAASTDYYTVVMTGNTETIAPAAGEAQGVYNGGLENVLRFLEQWSGKTVMFRGSIIDLWQSETADGAWEYGDYYTAPNRDWGYDQKLRTKVPPGVPKVFGVEMLAWKETTWDAAGFGSAN